MPRQKPWPYMDGTQLDTFYGRTQRNICHEKNTPWPYMNGTQPDTVYDRTQRKHATKKAMAVHEWDTTGYIL